MKKEMYQQESRREPMNTYTTINGKPAMQKLHCLVISLCLVIFGLLQTGSAIAQNYNGTLFSSSAGNSSCIQLTINGQPATFVDNGWIWNNGYHSSGSNNYTTGYIDAMDYLRSWFAFTNNSGTITSASLTIKLWGVSQNGGGSVTLNLYAINNYTESQLDADRNAGDATGISIFNNIGSETLLGTYTGITESMAQTSIVIPLDANALNSLFGSNGASIRIGGKTDNFTSYTRPDITTSAAGSVMSTSATLNGSVNPNNNTTSVNFQYGTTSGVYSNTTTASDFSGSSSQAVSAGLSGLSAGTAYYYRIEAAVTGHPTVYGQESSFSTLPADLSGIIASVSTICNGSGATLTANGTDGTVYWFTGSCGGVPAGSGNTITVYPAATTTYYAKNFKNSQYSAGCASTTISVNSPATIPPFASVNGITSTTANLSWGPSTGTGSILYTWVVGTSPTVVYGTIGQNGVTAQGTALASTSVTATGLVAGTAYYFRVLAYTSSPCGNSDYQTSAMFTITSSAPVAGTATNIRANSFSANWAASTGATDYFLDLSTSNTFATFVAGWENKEVGNVLTYNFSGLNNNATYYYRVRAANTVGISSNSNIITLQTLPLNNFLIEKVGGGVLDDQIAGRAFSIKITARDAQNTTVTDYTGSVTLTSNSTISSGSSTSGFTSGVLLSHSITLTLSGTLKTLTATDASVSTPSASFTVLPSAIHHSTLSVDGTVTAGTPFTVTACRSFVLFGGRAGCGCGSPGPPRWSDRRPPTPGRPRQPGPADPTGPPLHRAKSR